MTLDQILNRSAKVFRKARELEADMREAERMANILGDTKRAATYRAIAERAQPCAERYVQAMFDGREQ